ncbi:MFS transporter [Salinigranum halophilum]|uniref:MFS transporter n=1 Tax=Salinigranum halophilum TaxID=2565931 RepID=UPI00115E2752|nr:MFS transporter [Salinigranum halophilum]
MKARTAPSGAQVRTAGLLAGLFTLSAAAAAYEIVPASVTPLIRDSLGIGAAAAGLLVTVMYATSVVASVPAGIALDRVGVVRSVVAAGVALLVAGAWGYAASVAGAYWWVVASRVLGGLAYVVLWNAGANLVGEAVTPQRRATAVGVFTASAPLGFALGQFGGPRIAAVAGWPAVLPTFAGLAVVGMVIFLVTTHGYEFSVSAEVPDRAALVSLFTDRGVWTLCLLCFIAFDLYLVLNSWLPSYLSEGLGVGLALSGLLTAVFPAVGVVARTGGGVLSDRLFDGHRRPVAVLAFAVATPGVLGLVVTRHVGTVVGLVVVAGLGVQLAIGLLFSYVTEVVASEVRTTAVSLLTAAGLAGAGLAPVVAGGLIERVGYQTTFLVAGLVGAVGVAVAWRAPEPADAVDAART